MDTSGLRREFPSLNETTGMVESMEDVRKVGLLLFGYNIQLMKTLRGTSRPSLDAIHEALTMIHMLRSFLTPTSQKALYLQILREFLGPVAYPFYEPVINRMELSDTLPYTHPDAPDIHELIDDLINGKTKLSSSIEEFLRSLQ